LSLIIAGALVAAGGFAAWRSLGTAGRTAPVVPSGEPVLELAV
jgi:hypothetical protein